MLAVIINEVSKRRILTYFLASIHSGFVMADVEHEGRQAYFKCIACHSFGYHRTGPDHCGLLGRDAGTIDGFEFTLAMKSSKIKWTVDSLDRFLEAPLEAVPETSMGFVGIQDADERRRLIAYIQFQNKSEDCN